MSSDLEIANAALRKLGDLPIASLTENSRRARIMAANISMARNSLLRSHLWGFAMARAWLPSLVDVPAFGFGKQFQKPADCLRVAFVGQHYVGLSLTDYRGMDEAEYAFEGQMILSDIADPLPIRYVRHVTDAGAYDTMFAEALAVKLAFDTCKAITRSNAKKAALADELARSIKGAALVNSIEKPPKVIADDTWIGARYPGGSAGDAPPIPPEPVVDAVDSGALGARYMGEIVMGGP